MMRHVISVCAFRVSYTRAAARTARHDVAVRRVNDRARYDSAGKVQRKCCPSPRTHTHTQKQDTNRMIYRVRNCNRLSSRSSCAAPLRPCDVRAENNSIVDGS